MPVLYKRVKTKYREFVTKTKCFYINNSGEKRPRGVRMCKTGEGKKKRNQRQQYLKRKYEIYNNFGVGDWFLTLTNSLGWDGDTQQKMAMRVFSKVRKRCKRRGIPFMYYAKTEAGENVKAHTHALISNTSPEIIDMIFEYWQEFGRVKDIQRIYNMKNGKLVKYFLDGKAHKNLNYEKYSHSRNLAQPEIIKRILPNDSFRENPRPPKPENGYRYIVDKATVKNWFPDRDGFIYQEYELIKEVMQE